MKDSYSQKKTYRKDRIVLGDKLPISTPLSIFLDVSEVCNLRCNYCFRGNDNTYKGSYVRDNDIMSWETFCRAMEQIEEFPDTLKKISLSGHGEPLVNKNLTKMIRYINENYGECETEIHTNATILDKAYALDLADANISKIVISLQGLSSRKYREICGTRINFDSFIESIETLYKNRKDTIIFVKIVDIALEGQEKSQLYEKFQNICDNVIIETSVNLWKGMDSLNNNSVKVNKFGDEIQYQKCCSLSFYSLFVSPNGTVYPCTQPSISFNLGNIYNSSLLDCWNGERRREFLYKQLKYGRQVLVDCNDCYIAQNSIMSIEDSLIGYEDEILERFGRG